MAIFLQITITLLLAATLFGVFWSAFGKLRMPVRSVAGIRVHTVLAVHGGAVGLEQTVDGLVWLEQNGIIVGQVFIADCGLDEEGQATCALLLKKHKKIVCCKAEDMGQWIIERAETMTIQ